jgi:hypothetical protein
VLVSLGLLIFGLAVVGLQVSQGLEAARRADQGTKAVMLADTKLAELMAGVIKPENNNDQIKGDFGLLYPGYSWRFKFQPTDMKDFLMVTLDIGYSATQSAAQMQSPDQELDLEEQGVHIVETVYRLLPIPADVNLERDFGFTQEELQKAQDELAGVGGEGGAAAQVGDGGAGAGAAAGLGGADLGSLMALLGPLMAGGSFDPRMLANLPPDTLAQVQPLLEGMFGRGNVGAKGPMDNLTRMMEGRRGGRRGGRGGDRRGNDNNNNTDGGDRDSDDGGRRGGRGRNDNNGDDNAGTGGGTNNNSNNANNGGRGGRSRNQDGGGRNTGGRGGNNNTNGGGGRSQGEIRRNQSRNQR